MLPTATIFLTNRECPWRCLMCDLWRNTTEESVPAGAIPEQIRHALDRLPPARQVKLYNSGSFFDPRAIPAEDHPEIARLVHGFERVVVECHPALVGPSCATFQDSIPGQFEVAMGLETAHPGVLKKLNKRMTLADFSRAADRLRGWNVDLRVFILVNPPFMDETDALTWAERSIDFALDCGATAISLIPTRSGNGALDQLAAAGDFKEPELATVESALEYGFRQSRNGARIFADLWDLRRFSKCPKCFEAREGRIHRMNCGQELLPRVACDCA